MTRIFVVDDHAMVREGLRAVFVAKGHQVVGEAADVPAAMEGIVKLAPDIVVLDLGLEGRSGLDLLARLAQRGCTARVVVLTMSSQPRSLREREVMLLVVNGHSSAAIAAQLNLSPKTVDTYRSRLMLKLEVADLAALVRYAVREGFVETAVD